MNSTRIAMVAAVLTWSTLAGGIPPVPDGPVFPPGDALVEVAPFVQETPAADATHYDIMRGDLASLGINESVGDATCSQAGVAGMTWSDTDVPPSGTGYHYIIRSEAVGQTPGTYDNPGPPPLGFEGRDDEFGGAGGNGCAEM